MRLDRHVGGLGQARAASYLQTRGWQCEGAAWSCERLQAEGLPLRRAVHHQLTEDLGAALTARGWRVVDYSARGYAQLADAVTGQACSLPRALRLQARREGRPVAELSYALFLNALLTPDATRP